MSSPPCSYRGTATALLIVAACALMTSCATARHWYPENARPHPPGAWRLSAIPSAEPRPPVTPWWEDYRPLIPREQDTCALLQQSAQVDENLRLATSVLTSCTSNCNVSCSGAATWTSSCQNMASGCATAP